LVVDRNGDDAVCVDEIIFKISPSSFVAVGRQLPPASFCAAMDD
jgi:hypothetical protein